MIRTLWTIAEDKMAGLGYRLDPTEKNDLSDRRYTIDLGDPERDTDASTAACARVIRPFKIRLQFRERKDAHLNLMIAEEVERVVVAMRGTPFLFEDQTTETRQGGMVAVINFSVRDRWIGDEPSSVS